MMARLSPAFALLLALYSAFADAALHGRNATVVAGSGTMATAPAASFNSSSSILLPSSSSRLPLTSFSDPTSWTNTTVGLPPGTGAKTTISSSRASLTSSISSTFLALTTSNSTNTTTATSNATGLVTTSTPSTFLVGISSTITTLSSSTPDTSIGTSNSTGLGAGIGVSETTLTFSSSSGSITTTTSSSSASGTSKITPTESISGTTTVPATETSTATGYPVISNGQCKGPDCNNGACTGILCVSLGCSGSDCSNGVCTGLDCVSLGCIGAGCSSGVCTGSACVTSGCEGPDCDAITGECSGSDCISVGCSGSDCDSSTGSCSGPDCSTDTCSGFDCDKGSCQGSNCQDEGTQTGGGTDPPTNNPTSRTSNPTSTTISSSGSPSGSSCSVQTASLCAAACTVTAVPDSANMTTILSTSCYSTTCSVAAGCSAIGTTNSSFATDTTTSTPTPTGACMTVIPLSDITSSGSVVTTTYTATAVVYTITTPTDDSTSSSSTGMGLSSTITSSATMTNSSSYTSLTNSAAMTNSNSSVSATTISCIYQGSDPDQGRNAYCICSSSTFSVLTGVSGNLCAYTAIPTSTAVITENPLYTTTENCFACTIYGESNEDCVQISGCTPTSTMTVATTAASTTTIPARVTCTAWTQCPACPAGQGQICGGLAGQESCSCSTDSKLKRQDWSVGQPIWPDSEVKYDDLLFKRASDDNGTLSCPYQPLAEDTYCVDSGLSKRANDAKPLNLPWAVGIKFSNYPACPQKGQKGIETVPRFYYPAGAAPVNNQAQGFDPTVAKGRSTNGLINGISQGDFANDHVFEAQLISGFLSWLCGQPSITNYAQIPWPRNWQQPDTIWCQAVFGRDSNAETGYLFPAYNGDKLDNNFLGNCAEVIGGVNKPTLMAVYYGPSNGWKGKITKAQWPKFQSQKKVKDPLQLNLLQVAAAVTVRDAANVFSYFTDPDIENGWITPSKSIETICVQFDNTFWSSTDATKASGTKLVRPPKPPGVTNWGLRTLWAYWIDNHLNKIEQQVPVWLAKASVSVSPQFAQAYMQPRGLATPDQMHFPLDVNHAHAPIPGTQGSATNTNSRYMMWNGTTYGKLGL